MADVHVCDIFDSVSFYACLTKFMGKIFSRGLCKPCSYAVVSSGYAMKGTTVG